MLWSNWIEFSTLPATPEPPGVLNQTESTITLTWNDVRVTQGAQNKKYQVKYREDTLAGMNKGTVRDTLSNNIELTGLSAGQTYVIQVRVLSRISESDCNSEWSAEMKARTNDRTSTTLDQNKHDLGINTINDDIKSLTDDLGRLN